MNSFGTDLTLLTYPQLQNFLRVEFARARSLWLSVELLGHSS